METNTTVNFKARLQHLITHQEILARNCLILQHSSDQEFNQFLTFHNDLRRKYADLQTYADQMNHYVEQYQTESERKDKKLQSQGSQILRLTKHNKRNNARLAQLQQCLDKKKGTICERNAYEHLCNLLRNSVLSDNETTDLSDANFTGDELDHYKLQIPKVVSQSTGIGEIKKSNDNNEKLDKSPMMINDEFNPEHLCESPYSNILVGRSQHIQITSPTPVKSRHSLSINQRPKQKVRKPSKEFLINKSEESELSNDDVFWSKQDENLQEKNLPTMIYPTLPKMTSPSLEEQTLTPVPSSTIENNPTGLNTLNLRAHNFISRNILIPEICCVCLKRINFGKLAYRCQSCNALCHMGCKENCTTLCLPNIKTPNRGSVSKFAPREPMQIQVPALLQHCIKEIEQRGLQELGIYRLNVVESQIKELKERILKSRNGLFDLSHYTDIHLICGVIKDFLRSLSESLLTDHLWRSFSLIIDEESELIQQQKLDSLIQQLPKPNRDTLAFMIIHLQRVANSPLTRMPILNISRTMGPSVIGYSSKHLSDVDIVGETYKQSKLLEIFLKIPSNYWSKLLETTVNETLFPITKQQTGTPILKRQHRYQNTPTLINQISSNTFFSPI